jgi:hypothetical protein
MPHECRAYQKNDNEMQSELFLQGSEVVKDWQSGVKDQRCKWCCLWKCIKVLNRKRRVCGDDCYGKGRIGGNQEMRV